MTEIRIFEAILWVGLLFWFIAALRTAPKTFQGVRLARGPEDGPARELLRERLLLGGLLFVENVLLLLRISTEIRIGWVDDALLYMIAGVLIVAAAVFAWTDIRMDRWRKPRGQA